MFYLASTKIAPEKTASEIMAVLAKKGAKQILSEYEDGEIAALSFLIVAQNRELPFRLPVRWDRCLKAMKQDYKTPRNLCTPEQARRTAWRIILILSTI